jgi:hypothetical protein
MHRDYKFDRIFCHLEHLALAAGGLETISGLIHRRDVSNDLQHLDRSDWEGLALAARGLAELVAGCQSGILEMANDLHMNDTGVDRE